MIDPFAPHGEGVSWNRIQEGTELTRSLLEQLGLMAFVKTSGGKGLHVVVPIVPTEDWDTAKALSKAVVEHMATVIHVVSVQPSHLV